MCEICTVISSPSLRRVEQVLMSTSRRWIQIKFSLSPLADTSGQVFRLPFLCQQIVGTNKVTSRYLTAPAKMVLGTPGTIIYLHIQIILTAPGNTGWC